MADFKSHITIGATVGFITNSILVSFGWLNDFKTMMWMVVLTTISSTLPDIDSKSSYTHKLINFIASITCGVYYMSILIKHNIKLSYYGWFSIPIYILIHWIMSKWFGSIFKHRAIIHSIPMSIFVGMSSYLLMREIIKFDEIICRWYSLSIFIGFMTHLLHDEFHSRIDFDSGHFNYKKKNSANTAWDFGNIKEWSTWMVYVLIITCLIMIFMESW